VGKVRPIVPMAPQLKELVVEAVTVNRQIDVPGGNGRVTREATQGSPVTLLRQGKLGRVKRDPALTASG